MKFKTLSILGFLSILIPLSAQEMLRIEYEVTPYYESERKNEFEIKSVSSLFELTSSKNESYYNLIPKISNTQLEPSSNALATMSADANPLYKNIANDTYYEEAKVGNKLFLIKDKLPQINWIISKETKEIAGFPVLKATATLDDKYKTKVNAWYAPKLSFKNGPEKFWGLPGIILELETEIKYNDYSKEGTRYLATKVEAINSNEKLKIPNKGKEISGDDFIKFQENYNQKQMEMYGGGVDTD